MSGPGKSLILVLRRCVSAAAVGTRPGSGLCQRPTWSSASRAVCLLRRFCSKTGAPCESEYPPLPPYQSRPEPPTKEVYIVQVKGLPWSCTAQDLLHFFSECRVCEGEKGVHLTLDRLGRPSGRAFVELEHEEDVSKALEKHRQYIGTRYVQVSEVTNRDAESILKTAIQPAAEDGVVLLRGLPFTCSEDDIRTFFSGLDIADSGVTMVTDSRGRRSGEAFVQFSCQEAAAEALRRDRELMGTRYIEVFPSRRDDVDATLRRMRSSASSQRAESLHSAVVPEGSSRPDHYVHMRGLPFQATGEDIVKFFAPLEVSRILMELGPGGRPSGEADVFFRCHRDALAAMSRDRMNIGHRYIELFLNSAADRGSR